MSPRNMPRLSPSNAKSPDSATHPCRKAPQTTAKPKEYAIKLLNTPEDPRLSGYGSAAMAEVYANTTNIPPKYTKKSTKHK